MTSPPEKKRWPHEEALQVAEEIRTLLTPAVSRIIVAGSLRREKETVGDVEILYIPLFEVRAFDMFSTARMNLADEAIAELLASGILSKRPSKKGTFAWGEKNKLALHRSGITVDLFSATEANWFNYLVCRTGPADSNTRIAMRAQDRGWKWHPYGTGFSRGENEHIVTSERDVFDFVGLPYLEPKHRR